MMPWLVHLFGPYLQLGTRLLDLSRIGSSVIKVVWNYNKLLNVTP